MKNATQYDAEDKKETKRVGRGIGMRSDGGGENQLTHSKDSKKRGEREKKMLGGPTCPPSRRDRKDHGGLQRVEGMEGRRYKPAVPLGRRGVLETRGHDREKTEQCQGHERKIKWTDNGATKLALGKGGRGRKRGKKKKGSCRSFSEKR